MPRHLALALTAAVPVVALVTACGGSADPGSTAPTTSTSVQGAAPPTSAERPAGSSGTQPAAAATSGGTGASTAPTAAVHVRAPQGALPGEHVHGLTRAGDGTILLATHDGAYRGTPGGWEKVSPSVDLMGFVAVGPTLYASGHPGQGSDLPNPVGLLQSTDQGKTWTSMSRAGESDFHALGAGKGLIAGFDGRLRISTDAKSWTDVQIPAAPFGLAVSPDGTRIIATTRQGALTSTDRGATWAEASGTQPALAGFASDGMVYGLASDGALTASHDGGTTWAATGVTVSQPVAFAVTASGEILVATAQGVVSSTDGGKTTHPA